MAKQGRAPCPAPPRPPTHPHPQETPHPPLHRASVAHQVRRVGPPLLDLQHIPALDPGRAQRVAQRRLGAVEADPVLGVDLGGEGTEAQQAEGAELHQRIECNQQHAAEHGRPQLRQDDPHKTAPAADPQHAGTFLERRIKAAQGRGNRQINERKIRARDDQQRPGELLDGRAD